MPTRSILLAVESENYRWKSIARDSVLLNKKGRTVSTVVWFTGQQRRKGLKFILIGSILLVARIVLSYATYNPSSGSMWLFSGPIIIGGV